MKELELKLYGKVQGVGLRKRILQLATDSGRDLVGYVQNTDTGSVEVLAQGNQEDLEVFLEEVRLGTIHSQIDEIKIIWHDQSQDTHTDFEIW
jgi:acylphosphatase